MSTPSYPATSEHIAASPVARPTAVTTAARLFLLAIVVNAIGLLVYFTAGPGIGRDMSLLATVISVVLAGAVVFGLWLLFVLRMQAGKNWARLVLAALTVLLACSHVSVYVADHPAAAVDGTPPWLNVLDVAVGIMTVVVTVAATVLTFQPAANAYFTSRRAL